MDLFSMFKARNASPDAERLSPVEEDLRRDLQAAVGAGAAEPVRYAMRWTGTVQCVGFRWSNQTIARQRGLTGWVENMDDGSVTMEIQGTPAALIRHLDALHAQYARFSYRIWLDECTPIAPKADEGDFSVVFGEAY